MTDEKQREALLPCPFCGGEAEIIVLFKPQIGCKREMCRGRYNRDDWGTMPEAIAAWNTRPLPTPSARLDSEVVERAAREIGKVLISEEGDGWHPWRLGDDWDKRIRMLAAKAALSAIPVSEQNMEGVAALPTARLDGEVVEKDLSQMVEFFMEEHDLNLPDELIAPLGNYAAYRPAMEKAVRKWLEKFRQPVEYLVIESSRRGSVFSTEDENKPQGYIPRTIAEKLLGRDLGGTEWFTAEESEKMREHQSFMRQHPNLVSKQFNAIGKVNIPTRNKMGLDKQPAPEEESFEPTPEQIAKLNAALSAPDSLPNVRVFQYPEPLSENEAFLIHFEDSERTDEHFSGYGAREGAIKRYAQISISWNASLFQRIKTNWLEAQRDKANG